MNFLGEDQMHDYIKRFLAPSTQTYFLFGPRGTGKSTWLKFYYPDALRIDLLKPEVIRQYQAQRLSYDYSVPRRSKIQQAVFAYGIAAPVNKPILIIV